MSSVLITLLLGPSCGHLHVSEPILEASPCPVAPQDLSQSGLSAEPI